VRDEAEVDEVVHLGFGRVVASEKRGAEYASDDSGATRMSGGAERQCGSVTTALLSRRELKCAVV
jgi:hypothetical protein